MSKSLNNNKIIKKSKKQQEAVEKLKTDFVKKVPEIKNLEPQSELKSFDETKSDFFKKYKKRYPDGEFSGGYGPDFRRYMIRKLLKADISGKSKDDILYYKGRYLYEKEWNKLKREVEIDNPKKTKHFVHSTWDVQITVYLGGQVQERYEDEFEHEDTYTCYDINDDEIKAQIHADAYSAAESLYEISNKRITRFELKEIHEVSQEQYDKFFIDKEYHLIDSCTPIKYNMTLADNLNIPDKEGQCLANALYNEYKSDIPTLTLESIEEMLWKGCEENCGHMEIVKKSAFGDETKWVYDRCKGHRFVHAFHFFRHYKISWYYFDIKNKISNSQCKHVFHPSNYKAFIAYGIDNHCYLVDDKHDRASLVRSNLNTTNSIINTDRTKESKPINKFLINVNLKHANEFNNCTADAIYYDQADLKDYLMYFYIEDKQMFSNRFNNGKVTEILYKKNDKSIIKLRNNPNAQHKLNHTDIIDFCKNFGLEFNNQSITILAVEIFQMFNEKKAPNRRINWSNDIKKETLKQQDNQCNICNEELGKKCEFDHIKRLVDGGDHSLENCQALCMKCHTNKTNKEITEDYFAEDMLKSNWNSITKEIFTRKKAHLSKAAMKIAKIYLVLMEINLEEI